MKRKYVVLVGGCFFLLLAVVVWMQLKERPLTQDSTPAKSALESSAAEPVTHNLAVSHSLRDAKESENADDHTASAPPSLYRVQPVKVQFDPVASAAARNAKPFKLRGGAGKGVIVDEQGKTLIESGAESGINIFGFDVNPSSTLIMVMGGDGRALVLNPADGSRIHLPNKPPGEDMLGFGEWRWIDDSTLVGVSGKMIPFRDDQVGVEREEIMISRSALYLFDLNKMELSEVELPPGLRSKMVSISAVDGQGNVQLRPEGGPISYTDASYGWFEVKSKK